MIKRYKRPDIKNSMSLLLAAKKEIEFTLEIEINERSTSTIIRNIYENFRMLGEALLCAKGEESSDHLDAIKEIEKLKVDLPRPIYYLDNLRKLRHNINYYAYGPSIEDAKDVIDFAKKCFKPIYQKIEIEIQKS